MENEKVKKIAIGCVVAFLLFCVCCGGAGIALRLVSAS